jgi:peptide/nickel transport system ATP-binding protein
VEESEILCLVGESGCGKTTTGRIMVGLLNQSEGNVLYRGRPVEGLQGKDRAEYARRCRSSTRTRSPRSTLSTHGWADSVLPPEPP